MTEAKPVSTRRLAGTALWVAAWPALVFALAGHVDWLEGCLFTGWMVGLYATVTVGMCLKDPALLAEMPSPGVEGLQPDRAPGSSWFFLHARRKRGDNSLPMAGREQVDAVISYLRQQFAEGDVSTPSVEYGARFRVGKGGKSYDLQLDPIFKTLDAHSLSRWLDSHYIAQRMYACGPNSVVSLHGLSKEPVSTRDPTVVERDEDLLSRIRHHIVIAGETISSEKLNERAAVYFFEIGRDRLVQVDRSFLDADDGLDAMLGCLDGWGLRDLFARMRPRDKLVITKDGPSITQ